MAFARHSDHIWWRTIRPIRPSLMRDLLRGENPKPVWIAKKLLEQNMVRVLGADYRLHAPIVPKQPRVNQYAVTRIRHALGLSKWGRGKTRRWSYRNFYIIDVSLGVPGDMCRMIDDGLFAPGHKDGHNLQAFHVTQKGVDMAGLNGYVRKEDMRHG